MKDGQGRRHPRRHAGRGQSRPQLRQGLLPLQDHVRRGPAHPAAPAHEERRSSPRTASSSRSPGTRPSTRWPRQWKRVLKEKGPEAVGMFGSGQWTIWEGYAATKLMRAGFRSNNLDPNARHCMASAAVTFIRTFGMDEPMGCYDDFEHADAFVLWGSNMAEMHPILWTRVTDRRLSASARADRDALDLRAPHDGPLRHADDLQAGHRPRDPELHREPHHPDRRGEPRVRRQARQLPHGQHRHRLRPAAGARAGAAGAARQRRPGLAPVGLRGLREAHERVHAGAARPSCPACRRSSWRRWRSSTPTRRPR